MHDSLVSQRLVALFWAALALLNFPLLALWDHDARWLGLPLFPAALFLLWAVLIAVLAWVVERAPGRDSSPR
ncbi:MAG: hypothetical protein ACKOXQ_03845 [Hydrogenophaga sp.]